MQSTSAPRSFVRWIHRVLKGWFSAALLPQIMTTSALVMSIQWLVIAPRPKEAAKLATVELCHIRAWCSIHGAPTARIAFTRR